MDPTWYKDFIPGPGTYHLNYNLVNPTSPLHTFGERTNIWFDYDRPGPGTYNVRKDESSGPKYTMADKFQRPAGLDVPGPGTYYASIKQTHKTNPAYTMGYPWSLDHDHGIPGPGTYDLRGEASGPSYSLGAKFRDQISDSPGPGHYSPIRPSSAPSYSMGQHLWQSRSNTPGPGTYNVCSNNMQGSLFSMGKRFYRLRDKPTERRYSVSLRQRPVGQQNSHSGKYVSHHHHHPLHIIFMTYVFTIRSCMLHICFKILCDFYFYFGKIGCAKINWLRL
jgi:hypothetical protein